VRKSNGNLAANGTLYWYMTPGVVAESDLAGATKSEYIFFDGERVARRDGATGAGGVFYYFSDHLKTASVITDSAGVIKAESDYYPWGGELQFVNNDSNDYKFTGKKRDLETGLDYFGARYYSNGLGRWISSDWSPTPIPVPYAEFSDPQSLNLYSYVRNVPTTRFDADGHWPQFGPVLIQAAQEIANNPGKAWRDVKQSTVSFVQSVVNLLPVGDNKPTNPKYQSPRQDPPSTSAVGRLTTAGLAAGTAALPGPKGAGVTEGLADSAAVVRGGVPTATQLTKGAESIAVDGTLQGVSVQSANGATVEQLSQGIPNNQIGVTTVGDVRAAGGDVVSTPKPDNPCHCDMNGVTAEQGSKLFKTQPNPSKVKAPKSGGGND
jgi:RHS repeat-associated protein